MKKILTLATAALLSLGAFAQTGTTPERPKCKGVTVAGAPCKRPAATGSTFCFQHDDTKPRCGAKTLAGTACKRQVSIIGVHCSQHKTAINEKTTK